MAYVLEPEKSIRREVRRVVRERLDDATSALDKIESDESADIEKQVHESRKRCKEVRAVARLVRSSIGDEFGQFNELARDAARLLAPFRDAHAVLATIDDLGAANQGPVDHDLERVRKAQISAAERATREATGGDDRIHAARRLLVDARNSVKRWDVGDDPSVLIAGIETTYRRGRRALATARREQTDEHVHEWRKAVKNLWYQTRLLERAAPSILEPLVSTLDDLSEALGDDHDLAVLVERLAGDPHRFGGTLHAMHVIDLARSRQSDLRRRAFRLGATVYAEKPGAFGRRIEAYWSCAVSGGPELPTAGIADLDAADRASTDTAPAKGEGSHLRSAS